MTDLERYLRLATWSLWGAQKRTVRLELESHIAHKIWKYQVRGLSESEALQKTLIDLGQPHVISAGMTGVYTMPTLFRNTILVGLLLSLGIATFQSSAQVAGTNRIPIQPCLESQKLRVKLEKGEVSCVHPFESHRLENLVLLLGIAILWALRVGLFVSNLGRDRVRADGTRFYSLFRVGLDFLCRLFFNPKLDLDVWDKVIRVLSCT